MSNTLASVIISWTAHRARMAELSLIAWSTYANQGQIAAILSDKLGATEIDALRKSAIDIYIGERLQTCEPVTIAGEVAVLRQILNWAVDEQLLAVRPRLPTVKVENIEKPLPSDDDYAWYLRTMSPRHSDPLQFMLLTGLAPHELERIHSGDFDTATSEILIGKREDFAVKQPSRRRPIPLNPAALTIWQRVTIGTAADHAPFPRSDAMQKAMRRHFLERADAPAAADGLTPKMMRKWFASRIATEASEAVLQRLLGHAPGSPITRKHYVRTNDEQLRAAVTNL